MYDKVPALSGLATAVIAPEFIPTGPSKSDWSAAIAGVLVLVVREVVWFIRNRKK